MLAGNRRQRQQVYLGLTNYFVDNMQAHTKVMIFNNTFIVCNNNLKNNDILTTSK